VEYSGSLTVEAGEGEGRYRLKVTWQTVEGFPGPAQGQVTYTVTVEELYVWKWVEGLGDPERETAWPNLAENMSER
jgi:hypothetical protein